MSEPLGHRVEHDGAVATITLDRPAQYNALTSTVIASLLRTLGALGRGETRAIVLTGSGKAFCSGQALDDPDALADGAPPDLAAAVERGYAPLITALLTADVVTVAAVNGVAAGAGFSLACACDLRIVSDAATFVTAFTKIGLVPDAGLSFTLPRLVGYGKALELCLLSERIDAQTAERIGLCTRVVPADEVLSHARGIAAELARGPRALGLVKRALLLNGLGDLRAALAYEAELQGVAGASDDFAEGLAAFREKRAPRFRGR